MTTTLGLISDIHGDADALKIALALLHGRGADTILCAGDLVQKGSDGDAVVQLLREHAIPCVLGNHDEAAPGDQRWLRENAERHHIELHGWYLADETLLYLRELPRTLRFTFEEKRVLLAHGTPASNVVYLMPQSSAQTYRTIAQQSEADVIVFGHTHTPIRALFEGVYFFNPGSVASTRAEERRTCATLQLPTCDFTVFDLATGEPIEVPYRH